MSEKLFNIETKIDVDLLWALEAAFFPSSNLPFPL